jgi:hypothetical protein
MEVTTMVPQIINLFILFSLLCFSVGCVQVKHVVSDVKEAIVGEKEPPPKAPAESKETKAPPKAPPAETKETKNPPASSKKAPPKKTQPPPTGEVFGPK